MATDHNEKTLELACREADATLQALARWYDTLDNKIVAIFSVSAIIAGLAPGLTTVRLCGLHVVPWLFALASWGTAATACFVAFKPKTFRIDPNPKVLLNEKWLTLPPQQYRYYRLEDMAESYRVNREAYRSKLFWFSIAVVATSVEVVSLAVALATRP